MDYYLKQVEPGNPNPLLIPLDKDSMTIGRSSVVSLSDYNKVSRSHATFTRRNGSWFVADMGSLNNLYVNFKKVVGSTRLEVGDIIGFGTSNTPYLAKDGGFVCILTLKVRIKPEPDETEQARSILSEATNVSSISKLSYSNTKRTSKSYGEDQERFLKIEFGPAWSLGSKNQNASSFNTLQVLPKLTKQFENTKQRYEMGYQEETDTTNIYVKQEVLDCEEEALPIPKLNEALNATVCSPNRKTLKKASETIPSSQCDSIEMSFSNIVMEHSFNHQSGHSRKAQIGNKDSTGIFRLEVETLGSSQEKLDTLMCQKFGSENGNNANDYSLNTNEKCTPASPTRRPNKSFPGILKLTEASLSTNQCKKKKIPSSNCLSDNILHENNDRPRHFDAKADDKSLSKSPTSTIKEFCCNLSELESNSSHTTIHSVVDNKSAFFKPFVTDDNFINGNTTNIYNVTDKSKRFKGMDAKCDVEIRKIRNCYIHLTKCDSKYFGWPSDVRKVNFSAVLEANNHPKLENKEDLITEKANSFRCLQVEVEEKRTTTLNVQEFSSLQNNCQMEIQKRSKLKRSTQLSSDSESDFGNKSCKKRMKYEKRSEEELILNDSDYLVSSPRPHVFSDSFSSLSENIFQNKDNVNCVHPHREPRYYWKRLDFTSANCFRDKETESCRNAGPLAVERNPLCLKKVIETDACLQGQFATPFAHSSVTVTPVTACSDKFPSKGTKEMDAKNVTNFCETKENCERSRVIISSRKIETGPAIARRSDTFGCRMRFLIDTQTSVDVNKTSTKHPTKDDTYRTPAQAQSCKGIAFVDQPKYNIHSDNTFDAGSQSSKDAPGLKIDTKRDLRKSEASDSLLKTQFEKGELQFSNKLPCLSKNVKQVAVIIPMKFSDVETSRTLSSPQSFVEKLIRWNPKWLEEQKKNKNPPPLVSKGAQSLPFSFVSYDTFASSFLPMVQLEVWEALYKEFAQTVIDDKEEFKDFRYPVKSYSSKEFVTEFQCEVEVNESLSYYPCEGEVVLLDLKEKENTIENFLFGYVVQSEEIKRDTLTLDREHSDQLFPNDPIWRFTVHVKKMRKNLERQSLKIVFGISNIKSKLRLVEAIYSFKISPLIDDILQPKVESFLLDEYLKKPYKTRIQMVQRVVHGMKNPNPNSKVTLIHGPPGTGKTIFLVELVKSLLLESDKKVKILVCTSSYASLDEIGRKLVDSIEGCRRRSNCVKFVRFGKNFCPKLNNYTLDKKVYKLHKDLSKRELQQRQQKLTSLEKKINDALLSEDRQRTCNSRYKKVNNHNLAQLLEEYKLVKEKSLLRIVDSIMFSNYETLILKDTDILLSTLSDCSHPSASKFFYANCYCVVDDAAACTEPELLQCLHPSISRLVLVGDVKQIPPIVASKYAMKCGYSRSMLERFSYCYKTKVGRFPTPAFTQQYRMHSEICRFPSAFFYQHHLSSSLEVNERYGHFPYKNYVVYDIMVSEDQDSGPCVSYVCSKLLESDPSNSLGVLVASNELKLDLELCFSHTNVLKAVEVFTPDDQLGREKDSMVICCLKTLFSRSEPNLMTCERHLNTAITRSRKCLIIIGHFTPFLKYPHWYALLADAKMRNSYIPVPTLRHMTSVLHEICLKY